MSYQLDSLSNSLTDMYEWRLADYAVLKSRNLELQGHNRGEMLDVAGLGRLRLYYNVRMDEGKPDWEFDDEFDGGEETCGRVIVNLYLYIRDQAPGHQILVISRDPGAPVELPAWCRMTRNEMTEMQHPYYLITLKPHLKRR